MSNSLINRLSLALVICFALAGCGGGPDKDYNKKVSFGLTPDAEMKLGQTVTRTQIEFRTQSQSIKAGETSIWKIKVMDASTLNDPTKKPSPIDAFEAVHEKLMHFIVVSKDLSYFNHIHPEYKAYGTFLTETKLPHGGAYKFYADYTPISPKGEKTFPEVAQYELTAEGDPVPVRALMADIPGQDKRITKKCNALEEDVALDENAPHEGPAYTVSLQCQPSLLRAGQRAMLHVRVRDQSNQPLTNLQPYLGVMGHCVVLSANTKIFLHTHPVQLPAPGIAANAPPAPSVPPAPGSGEDIVFPANFPKAGLYKIWAQFKHDDHILTVPFVVTVLSATAMPSKVVSGNTVYVCPMHPDVTSANPNATCPRCKMALVARQ